ncbi:MAG: L,D-transpeptidase family protein [Bacteroidia bacterium]
MKYIHWIFLILLIPLCYQCKQKPTKGTSNENSNTANKRSPQQADVEVFVDSAAIRKYLQTFRERQELAKGIEAFYKARNNKVAWTVANGPLPHAEVFINRLEHADTDGLRPKDYRTTELKRLYNTVKDGADEEAIKNLDLLLTTEFSRYAAQLNSGITRHQKEETGWLVKVQPTNYDSLLNIVLSDNQSKDPFVKVEPDHPEYGKLKIILNSYKSFAGKGGWPILSGFKKLNLGDTSTQVLKLRERLTMTGEFRIGAANFYNPKVFDKYLDMAVKEFQATHGLEPDGVVAGKTLQALNITVNERIQQVMVNMERWRLMPKKFQPTYFLVNVPEFKLHIYDGGKEAFNMRVIVGKEFNATPVFSDRLEYIVFSPYWNVPKSITMEEILPAMEKNPNFLSRMNMEVVKGWDPKKATVVNAWQVPWYNIENDDFDYWIRQKPGVKNPLGLVKFIFPNNHNVYLHDTPFDQLFDKVKRDFSHGCIRVSDPMRVAQFLLKDKPEWTEEKIKKAMSAGKEQYVNITKVPVYILYFTTWIDDDGKLQIRDDIYGLDKTLAAKMGV